MSAFTSEHSNKEKSSIELFVDDFEVQNWDLSLKAKQRLHRSKETFFSLYCVDLVLCHIVIGNTEISIYTVMYQYLSYSRY